MDDRETLEEELKRIEKTLKRKEENAKEELATFQETNQDIQIVQEELKKIETMLKYKKEELDLLVKEIQKDKVAKEEEETSYFDTIEILYTSQY